MRYKFRAWDTILNKMLDMKEIEQAGMNLFALCEGVSIVKLMQWTGLTDRNGKEIFEGDIIESKKMTYSDSGYFIGMSDVLGTVVFTNGRYALHLTDGALPDLNFGSNDHVIKGNKFEHPELLKV